MTVFFIYKSVSYVASNSQIKNIKSELALMTTKQSINCWSKTQSLMSPSIWLENPVKHILKDLKMACLTNDSAYLKDDLNKGINKRSVV